MNQTVAPWIDEGRCLPTKSSYENLANSKFAFNPVAVSKDESHN